MSLTTTDSKKEAFTADELKENCLRLSRSIANLRRELDERLRDSYVSRIDNLEGRLGAIQEELLKPSRLGFVGQVSAGKTLLLETLLGSVGGILSKNVGSGATTGNIVEYCVSEGEGNETTFENWRARVVSQKDVDEIFSLYVEEFKKLAQYSDSLQGAADELRKLQERQKKTSYFAFWNDCAEWAKETYEGQSDSTTRMLAFEMFRISRVVSHAMFWLDREYEISEEQALKLMTLPSDRQKPATLENGKLDVPGWTEESSLKDLNAETFDAFFHIIHKLTVDVRVPKDVFKFYSQYGGSFRFVDCPGYGASGSSLRDKTLCFVELKDVDAVLVLLDAKNPGHKTDFFEQATKRWGDVVAREKMVVVLNKFDLLQIKSEDSTAEAFAELMSDAKTSVSDADVLNALSSALEQPYTYALENVENRSPRRVVFFSSFAHIGWRKASDSVSLGIKEIMEKSFNAETWSGKRECDDWKIVASKMDDASELRTLLQDFANDGGGRRLVDAFGDLVNHSGRKNQQIRMQRDFKTLDRDWTLLLEDFQEAMASLADVQESDNNLNLDDKRQALEDLSQLLRRTGGDGATELDNNLFKKIDSAKERCRIFAINAVSRWNEWKSLFNACDRSFLVNFPADVKNPPKKTTDFVECYLETITAVYRNVLKSLEPILKKVFVEFEKSYSSWNDAQITLLSAIFKEYAQCLDEFESCNEQRRQWFKEPLIGSMTNLLDFDEIRERLNEKMGISEGDVDKNTFERSGYARYFPLQHTIPLTFAWDESVIDAARRIGVGVDDRRHLAGVIQTRQVFYDAFALFAEDVYAEAKYLILQYLYEVCVGEGSDGLGAIVKRMLEKIDEEVKSTAFEAEEMPGFFDELE